jgi:hypothetical protein
MGRKKKFWVLKNTTTDLNRGWVTRKDEKIRMLKVRVI